MPSVRPRHNRLFAFAILLSALAHLVALGWLPGLARVTAQAPLPLRILLQPTPVALPPPAAVEPPAMAPAPPSRNMAARSSTRTPDRPEVITAPATAVEDTQTRVPAVAAAPVVAPAAVPTPVPAPAPAALDPRELAGYGRSVAAVVAQHQRYPRIAQLRQWQGTTMLQLEFSAEGRLLETRVLSSSGHEVLDRQALEMVRAAQPLPPLPSVLAGRALVVTVPVVFRLAG